MSAVTKFQRKLSEKQFNVFTEWLKETPRIIMLSGGK